MNKYLKATIISLILFFIFLILIFIPSFIGMDMMDSGYAISFLSFTFAVFSLVAGIIFFRYYRFEDNIYKEQILAQWEYNLKDWREYIPKEIKSDKKDRISLFLIISAWAVFFAILFPILDNENGYFVSIVMFALIILIGFVAFVTHLLAKRKLNNPNLKVIINKKGLIFNDQVYRWDMAMTSLESVKMIKEDKINLIVFEIFSGRSNYQVRIPVPKDKLTQADKIVEFFNE